MSQINIGDLTIDKFYLGDSSDVKIYLGEIKLYPSGEPQPVSCYEVISTPITSYTSTTYDSVFSYSDDSWFIKNNISQYEEYGVYGESTASTETYYNGKLAIVDGYEYKYANNQWNNIGEAIMEYVPITTGFSSSQVLETIRLDISGTTSSCYIYLSNVPDTTETYSDWYIRMRGTSSLIYYTTDGTNRTAIRVTACTLVSGTTYEFTFPYPMYFNAAYDYSSMEISGMPLVASAFSQSLQEEYTKKEKPSSALTYSSIADMEAVSCPTVGVGQYCYTNEQIYKFTSNEEWVAAQDSEIMMFALDGSGSTRILACGYNSGNISGNTAYDFTAVEAYFGNCVTSIGVNLFNSMSNELKSISATSVVPPITIDWAFGSNLSNLKIYVPCSSVHTYRTSKGWKTYANIIDSNEPNCQIESFKARFYDANNNLIGELQRTYDTNGSNITSAETQSYASSTYRVELGDAFVRIQDGTFKGFTHITNLSIGNNVIFVSSYFVSGCTALQTLEFPSDYGTYFSANLIGNCNSLKKITIPSGTTGIYRSSIYSCSSLQSITILKSNGVLSFWDNSGTVFPNTNNCAIYVPSNLVNSYKSASGWSTVASRIQAIPT